jgi:hypothetical protein
MTGFNRGVGVRRRLPLVAALGCLAASGLLAGCSSFKQVVGLDQSMPDEFAVETRAPLSLPSDYALRPPTPGAARPQEASAAEKARQAIDTAGPGKPGDQTTAALQVPPGGLTGSAPDPTRVVGVNSLASKLLGASDTVSTGEKRETSTLQGVY